MSFLRYGRRFLSLVASYCLVCAVLGVFLAESALHPTRRPLTPEEQTWARAAAARQGVKLESASMTTPDGAILYAWNLQSSVNHAPVVILLHGMGDNRSGMIGYGELLLKHDFSILLPDSRAHGESGGKVATYGLLEREDIRDWFEWLQRNQNPSCVFGLGESMGAAQLLQAIQSEPGFCAVVAESPFSSFREIAYDRIDRFFGTGPWVGRSVLRPVVESAFLYTRWRYGLHMDQVSPRDAVAGSHVPILLIHGAIDRNIPARHSHLIQSRNRAASLWEVPGADHCGAISTAPSEFETRVTSWFSLHAIPDGRATSATAHPHPQSLAYEESSVARRRPTSFLTAH
jgi:fermentation-respiration switch protein FrsA (DUF1100 family)